MRHILEFKIFKDNEDDIREKIKNLRKVPKELKEAAYELIDGITKAGNGKITGLKLHQELKEKVKKGKYPSGYSMGIDENGYFIHTHRGRSQSYPSPGKITVRDINFIDSEGSVIVI